MTNTVRRLKSVHSDVSFEAVVFGTASRLRSADTTGSVKVAGTSLQFSDIVKLLGVELDQALSMDRHVSSVASSCSFHIHALHHIRPRLTFDAAKSVAVSIVGARLDYCNSLLHGTSQRNFDCLQRVQNSLAHVVTQALHVIPVPLTYGVSCIGCRSASVSASSSGPLHSEHTDLACV